MVTKLFVTLLFAGGERREKEGAYKGRLQWGEH